MNRCDSLWPKLVLNIDPKLGAKTQGLHSLAQAHIYTEELKTNVPAETCTYVFIAAVFTKSKGGNPTTPMNELTDKTNMAHHSAVEGSIY